MQRWTSGPDVAAPLGFPDAIGTLLPEGRAEEPRGATPFGERVAELLEEVDAAQRSAETKARDYAAGRHDDLHGTMIALQQADIQLRFVANLRNRIIEAYREVMRMGA